MTQAPNPDTYKRTNFGPGHPGRSRTVQFGGIRATREVKNQVEEFCAAKGYNNRNDFAQDAFVFFMKYSKGEGDARPKETSAVSPVQTRQQRPTLDSSVSGALCSSNARVTGRDTGEIPAGERGRQRPDDDLSTHPNMGGDRKENTGRGDGASIPDPDTEGVSSVHGRGTDSPTLLRHSSLETIPNLWRDIESPLKKRVNEKNWEIWLSPIRFVGANAQRLVLQVPNTFFQEYLAEHYTEVIQEEFLRKFNKHLEIEFTVPAEVPETKETPVPATELAAPRPQTVEDLLIENSDRKIRQWFNREEVEKELAGWGELSKESPEQLLADWHRFEDSLLYKIKAGELERAKFEGGKCISYGSRGEAKQVEGFNQKGAAVQQALVEARQKAEDAGRAEVREARAKKLIGKRLVTEEQLIGATVVLLPQLRQDGDPRTHRQYHDREWREAAGSAAKRLGSSTTMSQSAFETEGGATRPDRKALEKSFDPP